MKSGEEPKAQSLELQIAPEHEKFLGPKLLAAIKELAAACEEFEVLVTSRRMSVRDLLEYMEVADLINIPLLEKVSDAADQVLNEQGARYNYITDQARRNKIIAERVDKPLNEAINACQKGRPILAYLLFQANTAHSARDFKGRLHEQAARCTGLPRHPDPYVAEKLYLQDMDRNHPKRSNLIRNEDQLVFLFASAKKKPGRRQTNPAKVAALFQRYKSASIDTGEGGKSLQVVAAPPAFFPLVLAGFPGTDEVGGPLQLCQFAIDFNADQTRTFSGTLSRLDGELYFLGSVVAPLKPFFESHGEVGLYEEIRFAIFNMLEIGEKQGLIKVDSLDSLAIGSDALDEVRTETAEEVEEVQETQELEAEVEAEGAEPAEDEHLDVPVPTGEKKARFQKGIGTKLSGLDTQRIVSTLAAFGIQESTQNRGVHTILEKSTPAGNITYPFPSGHAKGKETGNIPRILGKALKRFGIDRADFLRCYYKK